MRSHGFCGGLTKDSITVPLQGMGLDDRGMMWDLYRIMGSPFRLAFGEILL